MNDHPFSREAAQGAGLPLRESIFGRAFLWCLVAVLVPMLLVQIVSYLYLESALVRDAQARINLVGEQKLRSLHLFFAACERDATVLSRTPIVTRGASELSVAAQQRAGFSSERYRAASQSPFEHLRTMVATCGYTDALLVSPSGEVLLATTARPELGTNLRTGKYRDTELTRAIEAARATLRPAFSSFRIHPPTGRAAMWMAAPILQGRSVAGFVVVEISREAIHSVARDYAGLGATGEIILGEVRGKQLMLLTPTRDNRLPAFQTMPWNGAKDSPMALASEGRSGSGRAKDLRGVPSIAWWSYVPQIKCGFVVRMNTAEALSALGAHRTLAWWTAFASAVVAIVAAWFVARGLASPVQELERGVRRITGGDWAHRVGQAGQGEIGRLGRTFDQMVEGINSAAAAHKELSREIEQRKATESEIRLLSADLEKRVRERTTELEQRTQQLAIESAQHLKSQQALVDQFALMGAIINSIPYPIFIQDDQARFAACNSAYEHAFGVTDTDLKGKTVLDLDVLPEEERIRFHDEDVAVIRDADQRSYELTITFADGEEHPALYSVNGFRRDDGQPGGLIGLLVDITDHKRAEQELAVARQAAEKATREKGDLTTRLSETQAKLVASSRAAEEAARKATRERDDLAARLAETEEKLAESIRAAEAAAARQAIAKETLVVAREEFAEPAGAAEGEPVASIVTPAAEPEIEPVVSDPEEEQSEPDRQGSAAEEIEVPPGEESAVDDSPPTESAVVMPVEPTVAIVAEPAPAPPGREQENPAGQPTPAEPPPKPATRKSPRARKNGAPSPQQELFALDALPPESSTSSARSESKVPARPPESAPKKSEFEPRAEAPSVPLPALAPAKTNKSSVPRTLDVKALRLSLWTLESLLRNADPDAKAELEALRPQVAGTAFEARFAALAREIAGERFESAVAELERIKADLAG